MQNLAYSHNTSTTVGETNQLLILIPLAYQRDFLCPHVSIVELKYRMQR